MPVAGTLAYRHLARASYFHITLTSMPVSSKQVNCTKFWFTDTCGTGKCKHGTEEHVSLLASKLLLCFISMCISALIANMYSEGVILTYVLEEVICG